MRLQASMWKDGQHQISLGKCKLKQWDTTTHLLENPRSKTLTAHNTGKDVEPQELSLTAGVNDIKWYSHFESQFGSFLQN